MDKRDLSDCKKRIDTIINELYDISSIFFENKTKVINLTYVIRKLCEYSTRLEQRINNMEQ
jgi:hypothetical protein